MTLSYDEIFSSFLGYVTDYTLANIDFQDATDMMCEWLRKAYSKPYLRRLFSSAVLDDELQMFTFEMTFQYSEDEDISFTTDVLAKGMVIEWLQPQVKSRLMTSQFFGGKEQKWFSQAQHISELRGLLEDITLEQRKMIRDRGYINNSYLGD